MMRDMKKVVSVFCGLIAFSAVTANAQIDLGVSDIPDNTTGETLEQQFEQNSDSQKSFSFFDKAVSLFSSAKPAQAPKNISIEELTQKADSGDVEALLDLGYMYLYGTDGITVDHKLALDYYTKAAEKKNAVALNNLGSLYFNGIGTNVDYPRAIGYFDEAAKLGSDDAAVNLAIIYLGSDVKSKSKDDLIKVAALLEQAQANNNIAKYLSGYAYMKGFLFKQDYAKAFQLLKYAYDHDNTWGVCYLGKLYFRGWGTQQDYVKARELLEKVSWNNKEAFYMLGAIYGQGLGVPEDIKKGVEYLQKAGDNEEAKKELLKYKKTLFGKWVRR